MTTVRAFGTMQVLECKDEITAASTQTIESQENNVRGTETIALKSRPEVRPGPTLTRRASERTLAKDRCRCTAGPLACASGVWYMGIAFGEQHSFLTLNNLIFVEIRRVQRVDESRLDGFPTQDLPADRRWITFGIGSLVLSLACGLIVPNGAAWALFLVTVAFIAHVVTDVNQLPIRVASHFSFDLRADGWLNRSSYLIVMAATGLAISLTNAAVAVATSMAHADFIGRDLLWFGCYFLAFIYSVHRLVVRANRTDPPRLAKAPFWGVIATVPIALAIYVAAIVIQAS